MLQVTTVRDRLGGAVVRLGRGARRGSGLVVAENSVIVLAHALAADEVEVTVAGASARGTLAATDRLAGLALVHAPTGDAAPIAWAQATPELGDVVFALGDPGTGLRVTEGRVSAAPLSLRGRGGRLIEGIEHTAPMPRGSGGGPLVNADGALVGLNALRTDPGFLFAIGSGVARAAIDRLLAGAPEPARLGVAIAPPRIARRMRRAVGLPEREGLLVRAVEEGSPAAAAGVTRGDLIVGLGGVELASVDALFAALEQSRGSGSVALRVVRGVEEVELAVVLGAAAAAGSGSETGR